jgi:hypothetical protein
VSLQIQPYTPDREPAVKAFNQRLKAGGCTFQFPEASRPLWLPQAEGEVIFEELFLATDDAEVRGGYVLKHQPFWIAGHVETIGFVYLPLSEGVVNKQFNLVGLRLMADALKRQPLNYCLGMGGFDQPLPRLLKATGWSLVAIPFFFLVLKPKPFLQNITHLRRRAAMRAALDLLAGTGLGSVGIKALNAMRRPVKASEASVQVVAEFGPWTDEIWPAARDQYHFAAVRDGAAMNRLFPPDKTKYLRLRISAGANTVGWALALDTQLSQHKQFGEMRLGSIIDCLALPGHEPEVIASATGFLENCGVDLIVSNQPHAAWQAALSRAGFLRGPSNFIFAASPELATRLSPFAANQARFHLTRTDGEGPSHL